nr:hypothetical protein [Tanacetum cinerariifolium]
MTSIAWLEGVSSEGTFPVSVGYCQHGSQPDQVGPRLKACSIAYTKNVDFMMSLFKSDSKVSDAFSQFESVGASASGGSGGCGDDEESADDQKDEDEDGDGDRQVAGERYPQRQVAKESPEMSLENVENVVVWRSRSRIWPWTRLHGHGQGHGFGRGNYYGVNHGVQFKNTSGYKKWQDTKKNEKDEDQKEKGVMANSCYRCGSFDQWAKHCRTPKHLVALYQEYIKNKENEVESKFVYHDRDDIPDDPKDQIDATYLDDDDFFTN